MIEEATVDAYGESEQATGWVTMFESHLELPFETRVLGVRVSVMGLALRESNQIVAVCRARYGDDSDRPRGFAATVAETEGR